MHTNAARSNKSHPVKVASERPHQRPVLNIRRHGQSSSKCCNDLPISATAGLARSGQAGLTSAARRAWRRRRGVSMSESVCSTARADNLIGTASPLAAAAAARTESHVAAPPRSRHAGDKAATHAHRSCTDPFISHGFTRFRGKSQQTIQGKFDK